MKRRNRKKKLGRIKFYADENVDLQLIRHLRDRHKINIVAAVEENLVGGDDAFHYQEAKRRRPWLLTNDRDFLVRQRFPFDQTTGIVILNPPHKTPGLGWAPLWLKDHILPSGAEIAGTKIFVYAETAEIYCHDETSKIREQILRLPGKPQESRRGAKEIFYSLRA